MSLSAVPELRILDEADSTNTYARHHFDELPDGSLVVARHQTAGRGRRGRVWISPPGMNFAGTEKSDDASNSAAFFVRTVEMADRAYERKYYWFPVYQTEMDKDPTLVQAPFWDEE